MATSPVVFWQPAGLTLTARVFAVGSDTQVGTDYSPTESTNRKGRYSFNVTSGIAGAHDVHVFEGATLRAAFRVIMVDDTTEKECRDPAFIVSGTGAGQLSVTSGVAAVNVTQFGGFAGTFASGRPEVNTTHWGGIAVASANVLIDGAITAAKIAADAITDAKVASDVTIASVTGAVGSVAGSVTGSVGSVVGNVGGNVLGNVLGSVDSVIGWIGGSVAGGVVGSVGSVVGNVGGNVVGSVGSISGITFPTNFAALGINVSGHVSRVTLVDTTTTNTDMRGTNNAALAVDLATVAGYLDTEIAAILADTNELQTDWTNGGRLDLILDARASQTSVDDLPTNAELATALAAADDATLAAIGALNNLSVAQVNAEVDTALADVGLTTTRTGYLDNLSAGAAALESTAQSILTDTAEIGAAGVGLTALATQASVDTIDANVDAILVDTGTTIPDQLTAMSGATFDTATDSLEAIRNRGDSSWVTGASAPTAVDIRTEIDNNSTQLAAIVSDTNELQTDWANGGRLDLILDARASQASVDDLPTNAELTTALAGADDATLAAIGSLNNLSAAQVNAEVDTALADVGLTVTRTGYIDNLSAGPAALESTAQAVLTDTAEIGVAGAGLTALASASNLATLAGYVDTEVAAIKAKTDNLPTDPADQSAVEAAITVAVAGLSTLDASGVRAAVGLSAANLDTQLGDLPTNAELATALASADDATLAAISTLTTRVGVPADLGTGATVAANLTDIYSEVSGSGAASTGARVVNITVTDGNSDPLENALVRVTQGMEYCGLESRADGTLSFSLDDATWTVSITKPGYRFVPITLVVDGNKTISYSISQVSITPSDPGLITGYLVCYDNEGAVESGVSVYLQQIEPVTGSGIAYDGDVRSAISNGEGVAEFTGLFLGGRYYVYRDQTDGRPVMFTIDADQTDPMELPSVISRT